MTLSQLYYSCGLNGATDKRTPPYQILSRAQTSSTRASRHKSLPGVELKSAMALYGTQFIMKMREEYVYADSADRALRWS